MLKQGIWSYGRRVGAKDVTDGLSKTYLVGEKGMQSENYLTGQDFGDRAPIWGRTLSPQTETHALVRVARDVPYRDREGDCNAACHNYGSAHTGGWNVVMADGAVRSNAYNMHIYVHRSQASINGSEIVEFE